MRRKMGEDRARKRLAFLFSWEGEPTINERRGIIFQYKKNDSSLLFYI